MVQKLKLKENVSGTSYRDRLQKIIKRPANIPNAPPPTLGSPSDRGPSIVPPIKKESVDRIVKKVKMKKESLGQNAPDIGSLQTEDKLYPGTCLKIDIPTFIRIMELAREQIKKDEDIHFFTAALIDMGNKVITMSDYMKAARSIGKA